MLRVVALSTLMVVLPACDADAPAPTPPPVVVDDERPCEFATGAEIAAAVGADEAAGRPVKARASTDESRTLLCNYRVGRPFSSVTLRVESEVAEDDFRERMERDPLNSEELEGRGDLAFTHAGVSVLVWEDGRAVSAGVQHFADPDETRRALEELADLIDSKL